MTIGRIFPIRNPYRMLPFEPMQNGDTDRNAPLPFQMGVGASTTIETLYEVRQILMTSVTQSGEGAPQQVIGTGCNAPTSEFCAPTAAVAIVVQPVGIIRCAIS